MTGYEIATFVIVAAMTAAVFGALIAWQRRINRRMRAERRPRRVDADPCPRCGHAVVRYAADRTLWHMCFWAGFLFALWTWIALLFLPVKPRCDRCGLDRWDVEQ